MDNTVIVPWDTDPQNETNEFYVPEYIEKMAYSVLENYDLQVNSMTCITTKSDKGGAIWKLDTEQGPKSIKLLHRRPTRSLFSLGAQEYLVNVQKAKVPPIIKTKTGSPYVKDGEKLWFVAEWIEPLYPVTKDLEGAKQLCYALGEFHRLTRGYVPPKEAEVASRIHKWPKQYQKIINKMDWFRNIANAYHEMPASSTLLNNVEHFEAQAKQSFERLQQSSYESLKRLGNSNWGLVHQDYGWSNGQMGADGMWIIDLDGVAYDLPIRDLSKLISGSMADLNQWDIDWVRGMIHAYHEANPISKELYEILLIDLSLPTDFYKNIKEVVYEPELFLNEETEAMIQRIIETDRTKWPVLQEIEHDWDNEISITEQFREEFANIEQSTSEGESNPFHVSDSMESLWSTNTTFSASSPMSPFTSSEEIDEEDKKQNKDKKKDKKKKEKKKSKEKLSKEEKKKIKKEEEKQKNEKEKKKKDKKKAKKNKEKGKKKEVKDK